MRGVRGGHRWACRAHDRRPLLPGCNRLTRRADLGGLAQAEPCRAGPDLARTDDARPGRLGARLVAAHDRGAAGGTPQGGIPGACAGDASVQSAVIDDLPSSGSWVGTVAAVVGRMLNGCIEATRTGSHPFAPSALRDRTLRAGSATGSRRAFAEPAFGGERPVQYSSCSRTQLIVPALSLRPLGTRSSQLNAPISSSAPR
jgi:hypothetical protein